MKKVFYVILICIFVAFFAKSCIKKDAADIIQVKKNFNIQSATIFPQTSKNVTINGIDYLQSQAPLGKFGGNLISSTIGEGPKTFNPFNTKDATSATMADIMYDGLLSTDAKT